MILLFRFLITLFLLLVLEKKESFGTYDSYGYNHEPHHDGHDHSRPIKHTESKGYHMNAGEGFYDKAHIVEDIKDNFRLDMDQSKMTEEELQFYYFHTHDADKNGMLDGLEILYAMNHVHNDVHHAEAAHGPSSSSTTSSTPKYDPETDGPIEEFYRLRSQKKWNQKYDQDAEVIDEILKKYDLDHDGYLSYPEYLKAAAA